MTPVIRSVIFTACISILPFLAFSQSLSINTDGSTADGSAILDVKSTVKGVLIPRMSKTEKTNIISPATGLLIYQNAPDSTGFYFYNGSAWTWLSGSNTAWSTTGNSGTSPATNFLGTTDNNALVFKTSNAEQMRVANNGLVGIGTNNPQVKLDVLGSATVGSGNTNNAASSMVTGINNTVNGVDVLVGGTNNYIAPGFGHAIAVGNFDSIAGSATAVFGFLNKVNAFEAFAQGDRNTASGGASAAFGASNTVSGSSGFVTGINNTVSASNASAFGSSHTVSASQASAFGQNNTISGVNSMVSGNGNIVNATSSFVSGITNTVNGVDVLVGGTNNYIAPGFGHAIAAGIFDSIAGSATAVFGFLNKVTAFEAFAQGDRNTASGGASAAFGASNTVSSGSGFVTGGGNNVSGAQASAFGLNNTVSGGNSMVSGNGNIVNATSSFVSGITNTVNGIDVLVGGTNNYIAPGFGHAIAAGILDSVSGSAAAVFGFLNKVTSFEGFAQGDRNTASGQASAAFGASNTVSSSNGFVTGATNTVSGAQGSAFGLGNTVSGSRAAAFGTSNIAVSYNEMALGMYGTTYTPASATSFDPADRIFNVGIGSSPGSTADGLTILKNGNTGIGTASPTSLLDINSNSLRIRNSKTPSSATDTGNKGDIAWDDDYIYVCTATNTWKRVPIASW